MAARQETGRFGRSYRSLPVYWPVRWRLLWIARNDRRAGLPLGLSTATTPVLRDLVARRDDAIARERTRCLADVRAIDVRLAKIDSRLTVLQHTLARRTDAAARAAAPPTEEQLTRREPDERDVADELVRLRRAGDHRRLADAAREAQAEAQHRLAAALAEEAVLEVRRRHRADVARSRALRLVEYADRLAAVYRRALIRRHPQREALARRWDSTPATPPVWVFTDDLPPVCCEPGAAA